MAKTFLKRHIWLIDLIHRKGYISFREISEAWRRSPLNETGDPLSERTFFNHKKSIAEMFGIEILNDRSLGFHIGHSDIGDDETANWMLHTLSINNILHENADMKNRILLDKAPSSERFLTDIISAMRDSKAIRLCYKNFRSSKPSDFIVRPYCVKYFRQRWYMLGDSNLGLRIYSLDRFVDMEEMEERFELPAGFDAEAYFRDYFGVIVLEKPQDIRIRVVPNQVMYFRTLPIHQSQKEIPQPDGSSVFTYRVAPTYDFIQEVMSRGDEVEVLAPQSLREHIQNKIKKMEQIYNGND